MPGLPGGHRFEHGRTGDGAGRAQRENSPVNGQPGRGGQDPGRRQGPQGRVPASGEDCPPEGGPGDPVQDVGQARYRQDEQHHRDDGDQPGRDLSSPELGDGGLPPGAQGPGERPDQGGTVEDDEGQLGAEQGDNERDPGGEDQPGGALQVLHPGIPGLAGDQAAERRPDAPEQVGHADQVREDKVPVEPQRRHKLLNDLRVGQHDRAGQHREASRPVCRRQREHEDRVEVDAAQVGADPAGPSQPVGVGDVP